MLPSAQGETRNLILGKIDELIESGPRAYPCCARMLGRQVTTLYNSQTHC